MHASHSKPTDARIVLQGRNDHGTAEAQGRQPSEYQAREETDPENDRDLALQLGCVW